MYLSILSIVIAVFGVVARPLTQDSRAKNQVILSYTTDTHSRHETGIPGRSVQGYYSYLSGDGRWYKVTYQADERGYRAKTEIMPRHLYNPVVNSPPVQLSNSVAEVTPAAQTVETVTHKEDIFEQERIPEEVTTIKTVDVTVRDTENVLKEPSLPVLINNEPAVSIHVPLFTKVYTLKKANNSEPKRRKTKNGSSQIYRYKLAYLPSYGVW
ncbi:uncharacterized protein LOC130688824 isoform X2 [Daphnia carinata]|uniref:uncharacterized protein LOC130688824 isoform X2 n=1 Tax=Daphnia carinata TaxID=120202 RepID=UPI00257E193F|nr:uncharacterized protein LOC130688824 isoform X2 [Daphnia carinata]